MSRIIRVLFLVVSVALLAGCASTTARRPADSASTPKGRVAIRAYALSLPAPTYNYYYETRPSAEELRELDRLKNSVMIRDYCNHSIYSEFQEWGYEPTRESSCLQFSEPVFFTTITDAKLLTVGSAEFGKSKKLQLNIQWELIDISRDRTLFYAATEESGLTWEDAFDKSLRFALARPDFPRDLTNYSPLPHAPLVPSEMVIAADSPLEDIVEQISPAVFYLESAAGTLGTGFLISRNGYALTNNHVIANNKLEAVMANGDRLRVVVLCKNPAVDVALIRIDIEDAPCLPIDPLLEYRVAQDVIAIGAPLAVEFSNTITKGIISGIREINGHPMLQTDVAINPGNSGGPLLSARGQVVGIVTAKISGFGVEGIGFAIPIASALDALMLDMP